MSKLKPLYLCCILETEKGEIPITIWYHEIQTPERDEKIRKITDEFEKRTDGEIND